MKLPVKVAGGIVVAGALLSLALFGLARTFLLDSFNEGLGADVSTRARILQEKLNGAVLIAKATASFVEAGGGADRQSFLSFADNLSGGDSGLIALALVPLVRSGERAAFEAGARRALGRDDYEIYEGAPGKGRLPLGDREVYYPVLFSNTRDAGALAILGYDMGSSPLRRAAIEKARDSGEAAVTERMLLAGKRGVSGFVIFAPVYGATGREVTEAGRRASLQGFVQAVFSTDELVTAALKPTREMGLPFELQDLTAGPGNRVIYRWAARLRAEATWRSNFIPAGTARTERFAFAGREWAIEVAPNMAYLAAHYPVAHWSVLPIGLLLTGILAAYLHAVLSRREEMAAHNAALRDEIAARSRAEEALRASELKYRIVGENTADWEFWLDPMGRFLYSSPSSVRLTGYPSSRFLEDPALLGQVVAPADAELFAAHRREVTAKPALGRLTFRIKNRDGEVRWVDHVCQPVFDGEGRFIGTRGSNRDVTAEKRAQAERERLIIELQDAQRNIRTLEGILPICASCKKIRDESDAWVPVETYVSRHSGAEFSHGLCPECMRALYPDIAERQGRDDCRS